MNVSNGSNMGGSNALAQIDQQIENTIGKSDPKMAQALEQFLAKLLGGDSQGAGQGGGSPGGAEGGGQGGGSDPFAKLKQDLQQGNIGQLITDAMSMMSQGALPA
jgi:hypothetical protein